MFNNKYRSYVRNRPGFYKKLRRSGRFKGAELQVRRPPSSYAGAPLFSSNNHRAASSKRKYAEISRGNLRRGQKRKLDYGGMMKSGGKFLGSLGVVGRGIYSLAKRSVYRRRYEDPTDWVLPMFDVREDL